MEKFAQFVYDDLLSVTNKQDLHIIKELVLYRYDEASAKKNLKKSWSIPDILTKKNEFITEIKAYTRN